MSDIPDVRQAVEQLEGVVSATMRWPDPRGPAHLVVTFAGDLGAVERRRVVAEVTETLAEVSGVDLSTLRIDERRRGERPAFRTLSITRDSHEITVTVELRAGDRQVAGQGIGARGSQTALRAAAHATLEALEELVSDVVRFELEWIHAVDQVVDGSRVVEAAVLVITEAGRQQFVGAALCEGDMLEAAVRATLDALNRRLERLAA